MIINLIKGEDFTKTGTQTYALKTLFLIWLLFFNIFQPNNSSKKIWTMKRKKKYFELEGFPHQLLKELILKTIKKKGIFFFKKEEKKKITYCGA